ncbi:MULTISPECIES: high-potential iron-sulfur protein [Halorussus]|uniref:high-potential iron-sulfur protein n=1 Tax=Halorussus TaxID=1070314 RepID=UPI00209DA6F9|nr:high-potential iron-sulfur protein [Halorussus vallis]USZ76345.1 high-potential iron-sulfur protein [Halorussus vallis]
MGENEDDVSWPSHASRVLLAYLKNGEEGLSNVAEDIHGRTHDRPGEKFGKKEALYLPQSPVPPNLWRESCGRCRFWREGSPGEGGRCHVVGKKGDRFGGEHIHPRGWCKLWVPPEGEPAFAWLFEQLNPTGADLVRGEYHRHPNEEADQQTIDEAVEGVSAESESEAD